LSGIGAMTKVSISRLIGFDKLDAVVILMAS
jgi:hypothetical protein